MPSKRYAISDSVYANQRIWNETNWKATFKENKGNTEAAFKKVDLYSIWQNALQDNDAVKKLVPELFMDGYLSIHFASMGLYKYAYMGLRAQFETSLRLIYFYSHPVEFEWWLGGNEYYKSLLKSNNVYGDGYHYFQNIKNIKDFINQPGNRNIITEISNIYSKLSKYVHTSAASFQTKTSYSPKFNKDAFEKWFNTFIKVQEFINILFMLVFYNSRIIGTSARKTIMQIGIVDKTYKQNVKKILKIR